MECPRLATVEMCCLFAYTTDGCGHERRGVGGGWVDVQGVFQYSTIICPLLENVCLDIR